MRSDPGYFVGGDATDDSVLLEAFDQLGLRHSGGSFGYEGTPPAGSMSTGRIHHRQANDLNLLLRCVRAPAGGSEGIFLPSAGTIGKKTISLGAFLRRQL